MQEDCVGDQSLKAASKAAVKPATTAGVEEEKEDVPQPRALNRQRFHRVRFLGWYSFVKK